MDYGNACFAGGSERRRSVLEHATLRNDAGQPGAANLAVGVDDVVLQVEQ
jgi:hypothetical protein